MSTIASIVEREGGRAGHWSVERNYAGDCTLWHYDTMMLVWNVARGNVIYGCIGQGSVSDQGGVNKAFAIIDKRYHYRRDAAGGGARIEYCDERITL